jgi:hypothetical protein
MTRRRKLQIIYIVVLLDLLVVGVWGELVDVPLIFGQGMSHGDFPGGSGALFLNIFRGFLAVSLLLVSAPFVFLVVRPMGWGKIVMLLAALSWSFHAAIGAFMGLAPIEAFSPLIAAAATLVVLAIAYQIIDPSLIGRRDP